ncbi:MAG: hypothetical protein ACK5PZ_13515, partial [Pirellula sp.]
MSTTVASYGSGHSNQDRKVSSRQTIDAWVNRFGTRQTLLLFIQGLSVALLALIAGASIIVLLDALGWIDDATRWVLSLAMYAVCAACGIAFGIARSWKGLDPISLAKHVEYAHPELKESLLSCVELARTPESNRHFSGSFLRAIEHQVASSLVEVNVPDLLPWSLVRKPVLAAVAGTGLVAALCAIPKLEMPQRFSRALLPFLDLQRPSRTKIEVLSPARTESTVPENQSVSFEIEIQGDPTDVALLEVRKWGNSSRDAIQRIELTKIQQSPLLFAGTAPIAKEALEYRFIAGDAKTLFRKLTPSPRPRVTNFQHTFRFPEYTRLGDVSRISNEGDITTLDAMELEIGIEASMPLSSAQLVIESLNSGEKSSIPMSFREERKIWSAPWTVDGDARYQIKLKADVEGADQPIENTYIPLHEINAVSDHAPNVMWSTTEQTLWNAAPSPKQTWVVAPEEIVSLAAVSADDLPGATLRQEISVNRAPWMALEFEIPIIAFNGNGLDNEGNTSNQKYPSGLVAWTGLDGVDSPSLGSSSWKWDMLTSSLASGDLVSIRIAATDLAGQTSYSNPVQLVLASPGFDRDRHKHLLLRASLTPELQRMADLVRTKRAELRPKLEQLKNPNLSIAEREQIADQVKVITHDWGKSFSRFRELSAKIVSSLPRIIDQSEAEFIVRNVAKWEKETIPSIALATSTEEWIPADSMAA